MFLTQETTYIRFAMSKKTITLIIFISQIEMRDEE